MDRILGFLPKKAVSDTYLVYRILYLVFFNKNNANHDDTFYLYTRIIQILSTINLPSIKINLVSKYLLKVLLQKVIHHQKLSEFYKTL